LKVDREYKQIQKPADFIARTGLSLDIGKTLNDDTLSDDQKVKRYLQTLNRYYQVTDEVPRLTTSKSNPLTGCRANKEEEEKETCGLGSLLECHIPIQKHLVVSVVYSTSDDMVVK